MVAYDPLAPAKRANLSKDTGRVRNLAIENVPDGISLGAWHFLPRDLVKESTMPEIAVFERALRSFASSPVQRQPG